MDPESDLRHRLPCLATDDHCLAFVAHDGRMWAVFHIEHVDDAVTDNDGDQAVGGAEVEIQRSLSAPIYVLQPG